MTDNVCEHCGNIYEGVYAAHWNDCIPSRKASHSYPPVNMFSNRQDFATPKSNPLMERETKCPHCLNEYSTSKMDHEDRCSAIGMKRQGQLKDVPLFGPVRVEPKTEAEQISKLRNEIVDLKKRLNIE